MRGPRNVAALALTALLVAGGLAPLASARGAERFEVLQAVFHPLNDSGWTRQGLGERCVLVEQKVQGELPPEQDARGAADALLANTTRRQVAYAEFGVNETRFRDYYHRSSSPSALFDGLGLVSGGGPQAWTHVKDAYDEASRQIPRAAINVSSATVIASGSLDYEVYVPEDLSGYTASVRALIVEDAVADSGAGREVRFLVRVYMPGARIALTGEASLSGRLNFTVDPAWVASRLSAIVFVQVDAPPSAPLGNPGSPSDFFAAVVVPLAVLATGAAMAALALRHIRAERRARLR